MHRLRKASPHPILLALAACSACAGPQPTAAPERVLARGETLELSMGETVQLSAAATTRLRFEGVVSDHRCAPGADCAVPGAVTVALDVLDNASKHTVKLALMDRVGEGPARQNLPAPCASLKAGAIMLRTVEPLPSADGPVKRDAYRVRLLSRDDCSPLPP